MAVGADNAGWDRGGHAPDAVAEEPVEAGKRRVASLLLHFFISHDTQGPGGVMTREEVYKLRK